MSPLSRSRGSPRVATLSAVSGVAAASESASGDEPPKASAPTLVGRVLDGRFTVEALLGEGGLGQVYRGKHVRLNRAVAIKVMHAHHVTRTELRTRFDREARSLAALAHPNVVGVIDYGVDGDLPFLVMDFLEGRTLEDAIHTGLAPDRVVPIFRDVLRAVAYAHGVGLVHRDLKPANVFLQRVPEIGEVVRVLDFGLAKFVDGEGAHATVTRAGMVIGTPAYMSPAQATASVCDARADVYSLGAVLFEKITGRRPFAAADAAEVLRMHLLRPLPDMRDLVPDSPLVSLLAPIVLRATEKSKGDRYTDAAEMASALDAAVGRASTPVVSPPKKRPTMDSTKADSIHVTISDVPVSSPNAVGPTSAMASAAPKSPIGGLVVLGGIAVIALAFYFGSSAPPPPPATTVDALPSSITAPAPTLPLAPVLPPPIAPPPSIVPPPSQAEVAPPATTTELALVAPPTPNPWAAPLPPQLASIATRVRDEREISSAQRAQLFRFSGNHPHDARGLLLLGHAEVIAHAYADACHRYQHAFSVDPDARFDPTMRHDLVTIAVREPRTEASAMVRTIYGADAIDEIARVEGEISPRDRDALARLATLRASTIASSTPPAEIPAP